MLRTIGTAIPEVEVRDPRPGHRRSPCRRGRRGLVFTRGPHVMRGYYQDDGLTREVIDPQGWFNTGDLGCLTEAGRPRLPRAGRRRRSCSPAGRTSSPPTWSPRSSPPGYRPQAYVVGQDRKTLAALLLPEPTQVAQRSRPLPRPALRRAGARRPRCATLLQREAVRGSRSPLAPFERITRVALLPEPFDVADGTLTQTLKLRRHVINERYRGLIEGAYAAVSGPPRGPSRSAGLRPPPAPLPPAPGRAPEARPGGPKRAARSPARVRGPGLERAPS